MGDRITKKMLDKKVGFINKRMGRPETAYTLCHIHRTTEKGGKVVTEERRSNIGHLFIDQYNGYSLQEISNEGGGQGSFIGNNGRLSGSCMWAVLDTIEAMLFLDGK